MEKYDFIFFDKKLKSRTAFALCNFHKSISFGFAELQCDLDCWNPSTTATLLLHISGRVRIHSRDSVATRFRICVQLETVDIGFLVTKSDFIANRASC